MRKNGNILNYKSREIFHRINTILLWLGSSLKYSYFQAVWNSLVRQSQMAMYRWIHRVFSSSELDKIDLNRGLGDWYEWDSRLNIKLSYEIKSAFTDHSLVLKVGSIWNEILEGIWHVNEKQFFIIIDGKSVYHHFEKLFIRS